MKSAGPPGARLIVAVGVLLTGVPAALARHPGEYLNQVTTRLQTPHVPWARPYAPGRLKVLFIVPRTVAPREVVELWQRLDLEFEAFTLAHSGRLSFEDDPGGAGPYDLAVEGTSIEEKEAEIAAKLQRDYDAFVLANASLDVLPKEAQYKILRRVADGAGLVFTYGRQTRLPLFRKPTEEGRAAIFTGVPLAGLDFFRSPEVLQALGARAPADLPGRLLETFRFHQGRIAVLKWGASSGTYYGGHGLTPPEPYSLNWPAHYEYLLSLVARTLLWTVPSKQAPVRFTELPADGWTVDRVNLPQRLSVGLEYIGSGGLSGALVVTVRDKTNAVQHRQEQALGLKAGANTAGVELPRLKAGGHFLDLIVKSAQGTQAWGSIYFTVTSALAISDLTTEREFYEREETARGRVKLSAPAPEGARLRLTLTDTHDRLYAVTEVPVPAGRQEADFALPLAQGLTLASRLHGQLWVGPELVDARDRLLFVPRRRAPAFRSILWGGLGCSSTGLGWIAYRQLRQAGFNLLLTHPSTDGAQERVLALCDFPLVAYSYRIGGVADDKGWRKDRAAASDVADGCFYNPEVQQKARAHILKRIAPAIPYGPALYTLGDENYYDYKSGFSPIGQQAFRDHLKKQYGTIHRLNQVWGTAYGDWSAIELRPRDEALQRGWWPMIHEHMAFNESEYADYHRFLARVVKEADPHAQVGAEGSMPGDLEKTIEGLEVWGPYSDKRGNELLRSIAPASLVRGNWWGGYVGSHGARGGAAVLWTQLLTGAVNANLFYNAIGSEGIFAPDLSFADYFRQMLPELQEIYAGPGPLLAASAVVDDGLAIHWSQASEHAATLFSTLGTPARSQGNLLALLERGGFGYRYLTTRQIEGGALTAPPWRVLFLACSPAISEAEVQAIARFVEAGGIVIADTAAGLLDGHVRPLWKAGAWKGQLDELFGLARQGQPRLKEATSALSAPWGRATLELSPPLYMDASVAAVAGAAGHQVQGHPVCMVREHGRGRAVFLNFAFPGPGQPQAVAFLKTLLEGLGVRAAAELRNGQGYAWRRFQNGRLTLVGVMREAATAEDAELFLSQPAHVYDVRAGKALGQLQSVPLPKAGPAARLLALLPSPAGPLTLEPLPKARPGQVLHVRFRLASAPVDPTGRLVRVQVHRPDRTEALAYRSFVTLDRSGAGQAAVPLAFNDPAGAWTVTAVDIATGLSASGGFELAGP